MYTLKIKVTKEILEKSKMCYSHASQNCAIALALRDVFPNARVYNEFIIPNYINSLSFDINYREGVRIPLPAIATNFIKDFDENSIDERLSMNEIDFEIKISDEVINEINIDELRPLLENHPTLELVTSTLQSCQ